MRLLGRSHVAAGGLEQLSRPRSRNYQVLTNASKSPRLRLTLGSNYNKRRLKLFDNIHVIPVMDSAFITSFCCGCVALHEL